MVLHKASRGTLLGGDSIFESTMSLEINSTENTWKSERSAEANTSGRGCVVAQSAWPELHHTIS